MSDDQVPASADGYRPVFESRPGIPAGVTIDTSHPRYKAGAEAAHRAGLSQRQFSALLTHEVETAVKGQSARPTPAPAASAPTAKPYAEMSFAEKLAAGGHV